MIRWILVCYLVYNANCQLLPVIYAAPSAVSHQSRIDVKNSGLIATPFVYSPAIYATYPEKLDKNSDTVYKTVLSDAVLTPIALSFYHNLPLARALESPVFIQQDDSDIDSKERFMKGTNISPDIDKETI